MNDTRTVIDGETGRSWLKKVGIAGFLFFLIKGLLWLILPALWFVFN